MGHPRQPSRRLGQRRLGSALRPDRRDGGTARLRDSPQAGLEAPPHHHLRRLGRRGAGPPRQHRMGRDPSRRAAAESRPLSQHRFERPRFPRHGRLAFARTVHQRCRPRRDRPGNRPHQLEANPARRDRQPDRPRPDRSPDPARPPDRSARERLGLHPVPPACRHRVAQSRLWRRRRRRDLPLDLRQLRALQPVQRHQLRLWPSAGADRGDRDHAVCRRDDPAASVRRHGGHLRRLRDRTQGSALGPAGRGHRDQPQARRRRLRRHHRSAGTPHPARPGRRRAIPQFCAARQRRDGPQESGRELRRGLHQGRPGLAAGRRELAAPSGRAGVHQSRRVTSPTVVPASDLRPRVLHRIRCEDDARGS